jgi:hypothetical protein
MEAQVPQTALQVQITELGARMERGFNELKEIISGFEVRVRGLETREAGCQPLVNSELKAAWRKIDEHGTEIAVLKELIKTQNDAIQALQLVATELKRTQALISWVGGVVGGAALLWFVSKLMGLIA